VHSGWRGLAAGIVEKSIAELGFPADHLLAWMGPAIGPDHYEVGMDVFDTFTGNSAGAGSAFTPGRPGHWQLDLYALLRIQLDATGVESVYGGGFCTFSDKERFFSYRRDGVTGRQASLIWLD
jgi:YfiH family protein